MKMFFVIIGVLSFFVLYLSTPIAIGLVLFDWISNDEHFKYALWFGFKCWVAMILVGAPGAVISFGLAAEKVN